MSEKTEIKVQNLTRLYALVLLKSKESITGYYILKRLKENLGKTASPTYVYKFLDDLKAEGYIEEKKVPKKKRSEGFKLTPKGSEFVETILTRFNNFIEVAIQSKLKICKHCFVKLYDSFHTETINGEELYFCCSHCAAHYKKNEI